MITREQAKFVRNIANEVIGYFDSYTTSIHVFLFDNYETSIIVDDEGMKHVIASFNKNDYLEGGQWQSECIRHSQEKYVRKDVAIALGYLKDSLLAEIANMRA